MFFLFLSILYSFFTKSYIFYYDNVGPPYTHLCRALYGDAILVYSFGASIWPPEINKDIWEFTFSIYALSFLSRTSIRVHKNIF